jgi:hypothetical protein
MMIKKGNEMTKYTVYQLPETSSSIRDLYFLKPAEIEAISDEYELVATVTAKSLEDVFHLGNFMGCDLDDNESKIEIHGPMHSVSVGDIIHNLDTDETFVVARFGFEKITMKEVA